MKDYNNIKKYIDGLVDNSTAQKPMWNIEQVLQNKPPHWNYIDGCMMTSLLELSKVSNNQKYIDFADDFIDFYIDEQGSILGFEEAEYNLDNINEGRVLFDLFKHTKKQKYLLAADKLNNQLINQPRTNTGNFWHKKIYPNQIWLDGLYMAQVFSLRYKQFYNQDIGDVIAQFKNVELLMRDEASGLYYHGMDCSKQTFWANKKGLSQNFWLRAIGWFNVALVDCIGYLPEGNDRQTLSAILKNSLASLRNYIDSDSGMFFQVVDKVGQSGNYPETSGSAMIAYAMLKAARLGIVGQEFAITGKAVFDSICDRYLVCNGDTLELGGICLVAGLGPENNRRRDGSYAYYISEPIVKNDAKGVAPFVMCYTEIARLI